jgi:hypothetical protein
VDLRSVRFPFCRIRARVQMAASGSCRVFPLPDGAAVRAFGPDVAESENSGTAAAFCQRLDPVAPGRKPPVRTALLLFASSDLRVMGGSAGALTVRRGQRLDP